MRAGTPSPEEEPTVLSGGSGWQVAGGGEGSGTEEAGAWGATGLGRNRWGDLRSKDRGPEGASGGGSLHSSLVANVEVYLLGPPL